MGVAGFILDTFIACPLAKKMAFRIFTPGKDKQIFIILAISAFSIWLMCPMMSLIATILFKGGFNSQIVSTWLQTYHHELPDGVLLAVVCVMPAGSLYLWKDVPESPLA